MRMKKSLVVLTAVLLAVILLVPTGCAKAEFEVSPLAVTPAKAAIGEAVTVTVEVANVGNAEGTYSASLAVDGTSEETKDVLVSAGTTEDIVFSIAKQEVGTYAVEVGGQTGTLEVVRPAEFKVASLETRPAEIILGEAVEVSAQVRNTGGLEGTYTCAFLVDGEAAHSESVTLEAGAVRMVSFTLTPEEPGECSVAVEDLTDTITVLRPAELTLRSLSVSPREVVLGASVTVTAQVTNAGDVEGTYAASLTAAGTEVASRDVVVAGGTTETVRFTYTRGTAGTCTVRLGELSGTFKVLSASDIAARATRAMREVKSYQGDMTFTMGVQVEAEGETAEVLMVMMMDLAIDTEHERQKIDGTVTVDVPGEATVEVGMEMYLVEDTFYTLIQVPGEPVAWVAEAAPPGTWDDTDLQAQADLLEGAQVTLLGTEKVDGVDCYKLGLVPDREELVDAMLAQQSLAEESSGGSEDAGTALFLAMFGELMDMSVTQWVTTDTCLLKKAEMAIGLDLSWAGFALTMAFDMSFWGHDEPVVVELPAEAREAPVSPLAGPVSAITSVSEAGPVTAITVGDEIMDTIDDPMDADAFQFEVTQGETYIMQTGIPTVVSPLSDSLLILWDTDGTTMLDFNDDYGGALTSRIEWTAPHSGVFYVTVENADGVSTGDYTLTVRRK